MSVLAHRVDGAGQPVLFLNGGLMTYLGWEAITRPLQMAWRIVRCDLRGQLLSPGPVPSLAGQAAEVVALLDALAIDKAHVVGASFGGAVAVVLAALHPDRVASLAAITIADGFTPGLEDEARHLKAACETALAGGSRTAVFDALVPTTFSSAWREANAALIEQRRQVVAYLPDAYFGGLVGILESLDALDLRPFLARIRCPSLVVGAAEDVIFPPARVRALADGIPGAQLAIVHDSGHGLIVEKPAEVVRLVSGFLEATASANALSPPA